MEWYRNGSGWDASAYPDRQVIDGAVSLGTLSLPTLSYPPTLYIPAFLPSHFSTIRLPHPRCTISLFSLVPAMPTVASPMSLSRPQVSSPLAVSFDAGVTRPQPIPRPPMPQRKSSGFMQSRALRPFPTISHALQPSKSSNAKPVKLIKPPQNSKMTFVLDLTQAEFSRQE